MECPSAGAPERPVWLKSEHMGEPKEVRPEGEEQVT